jgi:hypothetical protein
VCVENSGGYVRKESRSHPSHGPTAATGTKTTPQPALESRSIAPAVSLVRGRSLPKLDTIPRPDRTEDVHSIASREVLSTESMEHAHGSELVNSRTVGSQGQRLPTGRPPEANRGRLLPVTPPLQLLPPGRSLIVQRLLPTLPQALPSSLPSAQPSSLLSNSNQQSKASIPNFMLKPPNSLATPPIYSPSQPSSLPSRPPSRAQLTTAHNSSFSSLSSLSSVKSSLSSPRSAATETAGQPPGSTVESLSQAATKSSAFLPMKTINTTVSTDRAAPGVKGNATATVPLQSKDDQFFPVDVDGTEKIPRKEPHVATVTSPSGSDRGSPTEATTSAHKTEPKEEDDQLPLMLLPPPNDPKFYAWVDLLERLHRLNRLLETKEEQAIALDYEFALVTAAANRAELGTITPSMSETSTGDVTAAEEISTRNATAGQEILSRHVIAGLETSMLHATAAQEISTQHVTTAQVPEASSLAEMSMSTPVHYVTPPPCFNLEVAHFREVNARLTAEISRNSGVLQRLEAEGRDKRRLVTQLEFDVNIVEREHKRLEADLHTVQSLVLEGYKVLIT